MGKFTGKACRLITMLTMTFSYFLVELVVGYATGSLALVADSFHMLSDVVALIVGLISVKYSKKGSSKKNTFGWARAEVLGAMVNAVFLVALCFTIFVEAIQRIVETEGITEPKLLLIVGSIGLLVNIIGLLLFGNQDHGHSHGGGGSHSHGGGSHSHNKKNNKENQNHEAHPLTAAADAGETPDSDNEIALGPVKQMDGSVKEIKHKKDPAQASAAQLNMKGVFLHVLGDALGSVVVIISAIIYMVVPTSCVISHDTTTPFNITTGNGTTVMPPCIEEIPQWVNYVDPSLSLILVAIILTTSVPLVRESGLILMQTVPTHIVVSTMQSEIEKLDGILAVHEFHVWSLAGDKIVASLHLHLRSLDDYVRVSNEVKEYFHDEGIHSVTIQPEFLDLHVKKAGRDCVLECGPEKDCHPATCCSNSKNAANGSPRANGKAMDSNALKLEPVTVAPTYNAPNEESGASEVAPEDTTVVIIDLNHA
ncbi:proton-coupled zinc antiporter SLC30A1-like [Watersipora subatra]|uniref:proton-coupled zinc antiporter SLC30A1-like n=1 Tax=Watersipora subatra TaxID=2589382 RepID=UPI00355C08EA